MTNYTQNQKLPGMNVAGSTPLPNVQNQFELCQNAIQSLRDEVTLLDERLGYVSLSAAPEGSDCTGEPQPERSPMAHNLHCLTSDINALAYRLQCMRGRLEI